MLKGLTINLFKYPIKIDLAHSMNGSVCGMNGNFLAFTNLKASCSSFYFHNFRTLPFTFSAEFLASKSRSANWRPTITWKQLTDKPNKTKCQREASGMQCSAKGCALWYTMYQKKGNRGKEMGKTGKKNPLNGMNMGRMWKSNIVLRRSDNDHISVRRPPNPQACRQNG